MNTGYLQNFISIQRTAQKLVFFVSQQFLWSQYAIPLQTLKLHRLSWLSPFSKAFFKICYFPKFHCFNLGHSKVTGYSIFNFFKEIFIAKSFEPQVLRAIFRNLFEDTEITTKFPKKHICNTSSTEINTFAILNN